MTKAGVITVDIETYRTVNKAIVERVRRDAIEKRPAQNVKAEIKACWDSSVEQERRASEVLGKTAVDVMLAETLCCVYRVNGVAQRFSMMPLDDAQSYAVLEELAARLDEVVGPETIWVGHNVLGFDFPVLLNQWRRHDILPPEWFPKYQRKRWYGRVYDTMEHMPCNNGLGFVSLDNCFEALYMGRAKRTRVLPGAGFRKPETDDEIMASTFMDGSLVGPAYEAGQYNVILDYCEDDVAGEEELYLRMTCGGEWGTWGVVNEVAEKIREIESGNEPEVAKHLAIFRVMEMNGLVPR